MIYNFRPHQSDPVYVKPGRQTSGLVLMCLHIQVQNRHGSLCRSYSLNIKEMMVFWWVFRKMSSSQFSAASGSIWGKTTEIRLDYALYFCMITANVDGYNLFYLQRTPLHTNIYKFHFFKWGTLIFIGQNEMFSLSSLNIRPKVYTWNIYGFNIPVGLCERIGPLQKHLTTSIWRLISMREEGYCTQGCFGPFLL